MKKGAATRGQPISVVHPDEVLLTPWAQSPEQSRNTHSSLQPAAQRDPQPPHPSLLMCALDVCLSLLETVKPQFSLEAGILAVSKLIWRVGALSPTRPVRVKPLQACSRPGAESRPPVHLSDLARACL